MNIIKGKVCQGGTILEEENLYLITIELGYNP